MAYAEKIVIADSSGNLVGVTSNALDINIKSGNPTSITANAGTNLNTSALALESGGNLASIASAVAAEDSASADADKGLRILAVRKATPANTSGSDGDYEVPQMSAGRLWVSATVDAALPAGSNAIGKLAANDGVDIGDVTINNASLAVTGTFWQATQPVSNAGTFAVQESGSALTSLQLIDDIVYTDDTSTHATGTSKGAAIMAVANPTDAAVDANDIGMVAMTLARALKNDITTIAGTAPTTAGFIDIKGADGNVFVRQSTASNLNATVVGTGTFAVQATLSAETTKVIGTVRTLGNGGATLDSTVGAGTAPTNMLAVGGLYNNTRPAPTDGQSLASQLDQNGNQRIMSGVVAATLSVWNSGTALNATQNIFTNSGCDSAIVHIVQSSGTFTAGAITFEITEDGTNWKTPKADCIQDPDTSGYPTISIPYTLVTSTNKAFLVELNGAQGLRIKLSTAITGTGTVTPSYTLLNYSPNQSVVISTGTNSIGITTPAGNVAHDAVDSGNPVKVGAKAISSLKTTTLVSSADRTDNQSDLDGSLLVRTNFPLGDLLSERVTDTGGTSTAFTNFSAVASTKNYITTIVVYNSSATAGTVDFRDGTGGSVLWTMPIPAGGGSVLAPGCPIFKTSANTALAYDVSGALSTVTISVSGFQSKI